MHHGIIVLAPSSSASWKTTREIIASLPRIFTAGNYAEKPLRKNGSDKLSSLRKLPRDFPFPSRAPREMFQTWFQFMTYFPHQQYFCWKEKCFERVLKCRETRIIIGLCLHESERKLENASWMKRCATPELMILRLVSSEIKRWK